MTKAKTTSEKTDSTADSAFGALAGGFEKAIRNYDAVLGFGKDTAEAYVKSATVAGKGLESLNSRIYAYSRQSIEDSITASKAVMASKSIHEAFEFQSEFAKSAFAAYVGELSSFGEMASATARESAAPLKGRMQAWLDMVQARVV